MVSFFAYKILCIFSSWYVSIFSIWCTIFSRLFVFFSLSWLFSSLFPSFSSIFPLFPSFSLIFPIFACFFFFSLPFLHPPYPFSRRFGRGGRNSPTPQVHAWLDALSDHLSGAHKYSSSWLYSHVFDVTFVCAQKREFHQMQFSWLERNYFSCEMHPRRVF